MNLSYKSLPGSTVFSPPYPTSPKRGPGGDWLVLCSILNQENQILGGPRCLGGLPYWTRATFFLHRRMNFACSHHSYLGIFSYKQMQWVEWWPSKRYDHAIIPRTCAYELIWKSLSHVIKDLEIKSSWIIWVALNQWLVSMIREDTGERGDSHVKMEERLEWCGHKSRDTWSHQMQEEVRSTISPKMQEGVQPCWHLDFRLLTSRGVREYIMLHKPYGNLLCQP